MTKRVRNQVAVEVPGVRLLGTGVVQVGGEDERHLTLRKALAGQQSVAGGTRHVFPVRLMSVGYGGYCIGHGEDRIREFNWTVQAPSEWEPDVVVTVWATDPSGPSSQWSHRDGWFGSAPDGISGLIMVRDEDLT